MRCAGDPRFLALSPAFATDHRVCHGGGWNDGAYCSTDAGVTWTAANTGLVGGLNDSGTGIAFAPNYGASRTLFVISNGGMARSADDGATWQILTGLREPGNNNGVAIGGGASDNAVLGNVISNNTTGVSIDNQDTAYNVVAGNLVGTDPTGAFAQANTQDGIQVSGHHNTVGGPAGRNVVSGNLVDGVRVPGDQAAYNTVAGNYIGTNLAGTGAIGNRGAGVSIHSGATYNVIGGDEVGERNLISGNGYGIGMWDSNTMSNAVSAPGPTVPFKSRTIISIARLTGSASSTASEVLSRRRTAVANTPLMATSTMAQIATARSISMSVNAFIAASCPPACSCGPSNPGSAR